MRFASFLSRHVELMLVLLLAGLLRPAIPIDAPAPLTWTDALIFFLLAPIGEEQIFRGWLQGWLWQRPGLQRVWVGWSVPNLLSSLAFAAAHLWAHPWSYFPGYMLVSLIYGRLRDTYRSAVPAMLVHGYFNVLLFVA